MPRQFFTKGEKPGIASGEDLSHLVVHEIDVPDDAIGDAALRQILCLARETAHREPARHRDTTYGGPLFALLMAQIQLVGDFKCGK